MRTKPTQNDRVLAALRAAGPRGITQGDWLDHIATLVQIDADMPGRPRCSHVSQASGRAGTPCPRRCIGNDQWCWHHNPERIAAGLSRVKEAA